MENLTVQALREYDDGPLTPENKNNNNNINNKADDYPEDDEPEEEPELNNQPDGNRLISKLEI